MDNGSFESGPARRQLIYLLARLSAARIVLLALIVMLGAVAIVYFVIAMSRPAPTVVINVPPAAQRRTYGSLNIPDVKPNAVIDGVPALVEYNGDPLPPTAEYDGMTLVMGIDETGSAINFTTDGPPDLYTETSYPDGSPRFAPVDAQTLARIHAGEKVLEESPQYRHLVQPMRLPGTGVSASSNNGVSETAQKTDYRLPSTTGVNQTHCYEFVSACGHKTLVMLRSELSLVYADPLREARDYAAKDCASCRDAKDAGAHRRRPGRGP